MQPKLECHELVWRGVRCRVRHAADFRRNIGWSRIDIQVLSPPGHPLPIAEDGYLTHQLDADELVAAGGVAAYFMDWLDRAAVHYRYTKALQKFAQGDLFG